MDQKYCLIIQCDIAHNRCSGFACTQSFYDKAESFSDFPAGTQYLSFTCGGCCGKGIAAKLEHFNNKLRKTEYTRDQVRVHLSSCMTSDNHHYDRCPHIDYIKGIITKHGFNDVVEGTYVSKNSQNKREKGIYKTY